MLAKAGAAAARRRRTEWAFEIKWDGVRALPTPSPGACACRRASWPTSPARYPELQRLNRALSPHRGDPRRRDRRLRRRRAPELRRAAAAHARRKRGARPSGWPATRRSPTSSSTCCGSTATRRPACPTPSAASCWPTWRLDGERWQTPDHVVGHGARGARRDRASRASRASSPSASTRATSPGGAAPRGSRSRTCAAQEVVDRRLGAGEGDAHASASARCSLAARATTASCATSGASAPASRRPSSTACQALLDPLAREDRRRSRPAGRRSRAARSSSSRGCVAEVEFREWTDGGELRAPSYKGLRDDERAELRRARGGSETPKAAQPRVGGREVRLTNLDKVLYPEAGFTKRDVIDYLVAHRAGRCCRTSSGAPLTLKRYPNGVDAEYFFEKNCAARTGPTWVRPRRAGSIDYVVAQDVPTLVWLANLADLELHTSLARRRRQSARRSSRSTSTRARRRRSSSAAASRLLIAGMFEGLGLECFAKTSGSKGMQVYVPLNSDGDVRRRPRRSPGRRRAARAATSPSSSSSRQTKSLRDGQGARRLEPERRAQDDDQRLLAARDGDARRCRRRCTWDEVRACASAGTRNLTFETAQVLRRVDEHGDLFAPVLSLVQELPQT